jgi:hypothetical protein
MLSWFLRKSFHVRRKKSYPKTQMEEDHVRQQHIPHPQKKDEQQTGGMELSAFGRPCGMFSCRMPHVHGQLNERNEINNPKQSITK